MKCYTLQTSPSKDDDSWRFSVPQEALLPPRKSKGIFGKFIKFTPQAITFEMANLPSNRILHSDDPSKFILLSFGDLRFPEANLKASGEYIARLMKAGLFLNNIQYRFYHHSNSQLRGRSCFLREANSDAELNERIYRLGDFGGIMNIAKRAKRIGLLFSEAQIDFQLDPRYVTDIADIKSGDEIFSDGCGLISRSLAIQISKAKKIIFRDSRYTPCVFQIRYLGYKGVLMLHPEMDKKTKDKETKDNETKENETRHLVQFRRSMKKFSTTENHSFSVVDYSKPYAFGRLNNDIIVLLSSLGITNAQLLAKQEDYFKWIASASEDMMRAIDFLSCKGEYLLAERVLLDGLDEPSVSTAIRKHQLSEIGSFKNNSDRNRARMIIHKSRLIFGVCDPFNVLKEGEVHIRITTARKGPATPIHGDVLVVRNPCLHPGDCLKLRAVYNARLSHLVDCIVFAAVARPGHHSAPSMSSGGDLDGDKYFVCWDPDLVPTVIAQSYDYPPNKEYVSRQVTRADLANHFAAYNNSGLARVAKLHAKWVRSSPKGALSSECQELNALHSQSVDGASIKIPDRLTQPPERDEPYIIDLLAEAASRFSTHFKQLEPSKADLLATNVEDCKQLLIQLLQSTQHAFSEYELFTLACHLARKHSFDVRPYLAHIDFGALSTKEKYALAGSLTLDFMPEEYSIWNSLFRSDLLTARDLYQRQLDKPFSLQRLYLSKVHGMATFFEYLHMATQEFTRKILILKTDDRFAVGIFMRGEIPWDEDPEVNENVVVCSFMPQTSSTLSTYRPCTSGYRLHCSDSNLQLYNKHRGDTFIFITRPPNASGAELVMSISLGKISERVQRQLGRVNRTPVTAIELHVVSNRDRVAHQLFDLWFEHVPTETYIKRFDREAAPYELNDLKDVDWTTHPPWLKEAFFPKQTSERMQIHLATTTAEQLDKIFEFGMEYHAEDEVFWTFDFIIAQLPLRRDTIIKCIDKFPPLTFALLKAYPADDSCSLPLETAPLARHILQNIIRSANGLGIAALVALEKISGTIAQIPLDAYFDLLMLATLSVRSPQLVQEVLLVLNDSRTSSIHESSALRYAHKHALAVAFDRAEEAADECPCNEDGKPRRQRTPPTMVNLSFVPDDPNQVKATVRIDSRTAVRLHSHVRLQAASKAENRWIEAPILDGIVVQASKGEMTIEVFYPPPPEMQHMKWNMYNAGSTATSRAMIDALQRLLQQRETCCGFYDTITGNTENTNTPMPVITHDMDSESPEVQGLNPSQITAIQSCKAPLSLIWGPPGTGKTTVVVQILRKLLRNSRDNLKILMTASTHNAVDNVLERFLELNKNENLLGEEQILRVATDQSKVNKALQGYTVDARVGGNVNENNRLVKQAQERVKSAALIFTTCAGAGLGILRKVDFNIALIDEASQITEPCALIPLVKGIQQAILVGDHVQLRPTVQKMAKALEFDVSLLERLYTGGEAPGMLKTMLNVQYRFPRELAEFPSREFYESRLQTGIRSSADVLEVLKTSAFPWPQQDGVVVPTVFIQCSTEEDMGGISKSNTGQAEIVTRIAPKLVTPAKGEAGTPALKALKITVLSPYSKQVQALRHLSVPCFTIDSFQGRESDIIIFTTVRCNATKDIGFVDDARRLNVMWTRARLGLIIIGDRETMGNNPLWSRAIESCTEVTIEPPS